MKRLPAKYDLAESGPFTAAHRQAGMDMLGCSLVGTITALGGGTIRDVMLGRTPVFWFVEQVSLVTSWCHVMPRH